MSLPVVLAEPVREATTPIFISRLVSAPLSVQPAKKTKETTHKTPKIPISRLHHLKEIFS
jgi:hypothetical protein